MPIDTTYETVSRLLSNGHAADSRLYPSYISLMVGGILIVSVHDHEVVVHLIENLLPIRELSVVAAAPASEGTLHP